MMSDNMRGALLMMASMAAFTASDTVMKLLAPELPLFQTIVWRGVLVSVILFLLARRSGAFAVRISPRDKRLIALRSLADTCAAYFFLQALYNMPIANLTAILQALPLVVTLAAALLFKEQVGWRRFLAIGVGFSGVLLIVRPDADGFDPFAIYALIAVSFVTGRELFTRGMAKTVPSFVVSFWNGVSVTLMGAGFTLIGPPLVMPSPYAAMLVVGTGGILVAAMVLSVMAMRQGDLGFVSPFRYTGLIWALLLGFVVLGEWPDNLTLLGAGLIAATGLFSFYRERVKAARLRAPVLR